MSNKEETDFYSDENLQSVEDVDLDISNDTQVVEEDSTPKGTSDSSEDDGTVVNEESLAKTYTIDVGDMELEVEDSEDDENVFSPDERLKFFADELMSNCFGKQRSLETKLYALNKLIEISNPNVFRDENFILYNIIYNFKAKLRTIDIDEEFVKLYLMRNKGLITKSRLQIDISAYGEVDGSQELGYISGVVKHFKRLLTMPDLSEIEYNTIFEKYIIEYKAIEAEKVYSKAQLILTDGLKVRSKVWSGFEDSYNFVRRKLAEIEGVNNAEKGTGFKNARELLMEESEANKSYKVSDFDKLDALNNVYGGIYTGMFYQVIAPPKAGKTKFVTRIVHTTAVKWGQNVTVWAAEGGTEAFLAEVRSIHFDYTYNSGVSISDKKFGVSQDVILHNKFPNDELKMLELSSKMDLASNTDYGSIDFIDRPFEVETFLEDIDTSIKSNHSKVLVIDYLQLIGSSTGKNDRERVSEAYKKLLAYCRKQNIAVITPGQYKQNAFEELLSKSSTADADMRTSAGVSSEVIRTPDIIFALWATTQDIQNNSMKILSVPCRFNKPFPEIDVMIDLGTCQFISK